MVAHAEGTDKVPATALIRVTIKTGRLHQIRAHMMFVNCQVLGDDIYLAPPPPPAAGAGAVERWVDDLPRPPRLCLHAFHLGFKHPITGKWVHFYSELPGDLAQLCGEDWIDRAGVDEGQREIATNRHRQMGKK